MTACAHLPESPYFGPPAVMQCHIEAELRGIAIASPRSRSFSATANEVSKHHGEVLHACLSTRFLRDVHCGRVYHFNTIL